MNRRVQGSRFEIYIAHELQGLGGQGAISMRLPLIGIKLTVTLQDAETIGEALIACVRAAEASVRRDY